MTRLREGCGAAGRESDIRIEKLPGGAAVIHMEGRPLCLVAAKPAAELDRLMETVARLPLPAGRAVAVANALAAAFAFGVVAGQGALMFRDEIEVTAADFGPAAPLPAAEGGEA